MTEPHAEEMHELVSAYLDGELDPAARERVERALQDDPALQRDLERWRRLDQAMAAPEPPAVSAAQWQRLWRGVGERTGGMPERGARRRILRLALMAAAAAAVLAAAVMLSVLLPRRRLALPEEIAETAPVVEEIEAGEGFRTVNTKLDDDATRIDFEKKAVGE